MKKILITLNILLSGIVLCAVQSNRPNVLIIYTDDQGHTDLSCFGAQGLQTPNLDKLAEGGIQLNSYYSASSVCTPSRASLQTGKYFVNTKGGSGLYWPYSTSGLSPEEFTLGDMLRSVGYNTALIGKWHLGHLDEYLPTNNGYDYFYGIPYSNDMWSSADLKPAKDIVMREGVSIEQMLKIHPKKEGKFWGRVPLMRNNEVIEYPADQASITQRYTDESIKFMAESVKEGKPFYVCLTHSMPHIPLYVSSSFKDTAQRGLYGDVIQEIDANIGRIMQYLKDNNLYENTFIFFASDNGPWLGLKNGGGGTSTNLRNGKFSYFEGGFRVPAIISYPAKFKKAFVSEEMISSIDILPTLANLTGFKNLPKDLDGLDTTDFLTGDVKESPRQTMLYYPSKGNKPMAIRSGNYKLLFENHTHKQCLKNDEERGYKDFETKDIELFDLSKDLAERNNIAKENQEVVKELRELSKSLNKKK